MSENKDKYKMFRNFMTNELGITKADLEIWAKEAVAEETRKLIGQINIKGIATDTVQKDIYKLRRELTEVIVEKLDIVVKEKL